jgi:allene oxide cyclase
MKTRPWNTRDAILGGLLGGLLGGCDGEGGERVVILEVVERAENEEVLDLGAMGDSMGDVLTFANDVYDAANEAKLGTDQGYCVRVRPGEAWECNWTLTLDEGSLTVEGPFLDVGDSVFAIIGGTGEYRGASGEMTLSARDGDEPAYDFVYEIVL